MFKARPGVSLYIQIREHMRDRILVGEWNPGEPIPSEMELCKYYGVSRITIRNAMHCLQQDGLIIKRQGKDTIVNPAQFYQRRGAMYTFSEELKKLGVKISSYVISFKKVASEDAVASTLKIKPGSPVFELQRIRYAGGVEFALEYTHMPYSLTSSLTIESIEKNGLYASLQSQCGIVPASAKELLSAVNLDYKQAKYLKVDEGSAALYLQRMTAFNSRIVEYSKYFIRADRYKFTVHLGENGEEQTSANFF